MEPLKNEPGLEGSSEKAINFYNAYIRLESAETAMVGMLTHPPSEFKTVIQLHFKRNWASLIRPDLLAWADKYNFEADDSTNANSLNGQIARLQWFRQAVGTGNYKKIIMSIIQRMDLLVTGRVEELEDGEGEMMVDQPVGKSLPPIASASTGAAAAAASFPVAMGGGASKSTTASVSSKSNRGSSSQA